MPRINIAIAVVSFVITCVALPISCFHGDVVIGGGLKALLCVGLSNLCCSYKRITACEFLDNKNSHAVIALILSVAMLMYVTKH